MKKKSFFQKPIFYIFFIPFAINLWKILYLKYTFYEAGQLFLFDLLFVGILIFLMVWNPLKYMVVYTALFILFFISFLWSYPPCGIFEWIAAVLLFTIIYFLMPRIQILLPLAMIGLLIAFIIIRIILPLEARLEANSELAKNYIYVLGRNLMSEIANNRNFMIGSEKFRYYMENDNNFVQRLKKAKRLNKNLWKKFDKYHISLVRWKYFRDNLVEANSGQWEITYWGSTNAILKDKKYIESWMIPLKDHEFQYSPSVSLEVKPFTIVICMSSDGIYHIIDFPQDIDFEFVKSDDHK